MKPISFVAAMLLLTGAMSCKKAPTQADAHCLPSDPNGPQYMNHEVPIIVEDGSILIQIYKQHFDELILAKIPDRPAAKAVSPQAQTTTLDRVGSWHTHEGDHKLQIAVASSSGSPVLQEVTLLTTDKVELLLERVLLSGAEPAASVWYTKEPDSLLKTPCHGTGKNDAERTAWIMKGSGVLQRPSKSIVNPPSYFYLEYTDDLGNQAPLRLAGVKVWSAFQPSDPAAVKKSEFKLGTGCSAVQICPNDKDGVPTCTPMNPVCKGISTTTPGGGNPQK